MKTKLLFVFMLALVSASAADTIITSAVIGTNGTLGPGAGNGKVFGHLSGSPVFVGIAGGASGCIVMDVTADPYTIEFDEGCLAALAFPWTGAHDFSGATLEIPNSNTLPGTCSVGQIHFDADATAGSNMYGCTSVNVWTLLGGGYTAGAGSTSDLVVLTNATVGSANSTTSAFTVDQARLMLFNVPDDTTISACRIYVTTGAAGTAYFGVYSLAGTRLCGGSGDTASSATVVSSACSEGATVVIPRGWVYLAVASSSVTPTYQTLTGSSAISAFVNGGTTGIVLGTYASAVSGGALLSSITPASIAKASGSFAFPLMACSR